jgi:hypothetical protein
MKMVKNLKLGLILVFMTAFLLTSVPAWAATVYVGNSPVVVDAVESGVKLQIPSESYVHGYTCVIEPTEYNKIVPLQSFYVTKSVDISFKETNRGIIHLSKPARIVFSFDDIDFKRASLMKTYLPVGSFRIGRWDDALQTWNELPSLIFWDGSTGIIEAEVRDPGRYALLWSYDTSSLISPAAAEGIRIMVNYTLLDPDTAPYINNGRTMIPLRAAADSLNVIVNWNNAEKRVDLTNSKGTVVKLWIGNTMALIDDRQVTIDAPPAIMNGRTFVPLRFVSEALGVSVTWDSFTRTAYLTSS